MSEYQLDESVSQRIQQSRFLRACRREQVDATPIWVMRQAGRYMPEYMKIRNNRNFLEIVKEPELAAEVTMQPMNAFDMDAAIIFSDILPPLEAMGLELEFSPKPLIHNPIRTEQDVARLQLPDPEIALDYTLESIRRVRAMLDPRGLPLIGFGASPFTLAQFAIEGTSSKNAQHVRKVMMSEPDLWDALLSKLTEMIASHLKAQVRAGANALQIFDAWSGWLAPNDYRRYSRPYTQRLITMLQATGVPTLHAVTDGSAMLVDIAEVQSDVVGLDWRIDLGDAWERIGHHRAIQGNLDPATLLATWDAVQQRATYILDQAGGRPGHIFNLGHGVPRPTPADRPQPVENLKRLVDFVHDYTRRD